MLQALMPTIIVLSWLALPVTILCVIDDWFLRPRRALGAQSAAPGAGAGAAPRAPVSAAADAALMRRADGPGAEGSAGAPAAVRGAAPPPPSAAGDGPIMT